MWRLEITSWWLWILYLSFHCVKDFEFLTNRKVSCSLKALGHDEEP